MTGISKIILFAVLAPVAVLFGCSEHKDSHVVYVPEGHNVYAIARKGEFIRDENFDVVLVHGFNNNREIARQLTDYFNQSEPETYHFYEAD